MSGPPPGRGRWSGSSLSGELDQPAVVGLAQLLAEDAAGDRDGQVGGLRPDLHEGLVAWRRRSRVRPARGRPRPRPGPSGRSSRRRNQGVLAGLLDQGPDLVGGLVELPRCSAARDSASFRARSVSSRTCSRWASRSRRAFISGFQANRPRTPSSTQEDDQRPDRQGRLDGHDVRGLAVGEVVALVAGLGRLGHRFESVFLVLLGVGRGGRRLGGGRRVLALRRGGALGGGGPRPGGEQDEGQQPEGRDRLPGHGRDSSAIRRGSG